MEKAVKSELLAHPHVKKLWELSGDKSLFTKSPEELFSLRRDLLRSSLKFFAEMSDFYEELFNRIGIDPGSAELEDLVKLAVPSDLLRGEGYKRFLIEQVKSEPGIVFSSSGTTSNTPVRVYRTYLELAMMTRANTLLFEYVYGGELERGRGIALFLAAKELRSRLNFVAFVDLALQGKEIPLLYGMVLSKEEAGGSQWKKLVPNKKAIMEFFKSKEEPKLLFTAPAGIYLLSKQFENMNPFLKILSKTVYRIPPVDLGEGGVIVTGGGSKGFQIPDYDTIVKYSRKFFNARRNGLELPTPFMDVLGMTETLTALIDNYDVMGKIPHPLQEVFLIDPKTFKLVQEPDRDGILGIFDPLAVSWLAVFLPGDIVRFKYSNRYYGKEFQYVRRLSKDEGWELQRACGGTLEEMMSSG
jgi:phenylacetate-CoA ligase